MTLGSVRIAPSGRDDPEPGPGHATLDRLLVAATLTPSQACVVAGCVLAAVGGSGASSMAARAVVVTDDGTVRVTEPGRPAALLAELAANAERPAARRGAQADLLTALSRAHDALRASGPDSARAVLASAMAGGGVDAEEVRRELRALVRALAGLSEAPAAPPFLPVAPPPPPTALPAATAALVRPARPSALPGPLPLPRTRRGPRRTVLAAIAVLIVAAAAAAAGVMLTRRPAPLHPAARSRPPAESTVPAARASGPRPAARAATAADLAPSAAGVVAGVTVAPEHGCSPGGTCTATITVALRSPHGQADFTYRVVALGCRGAVTPLDSGSMVALPSWNSPYATDAFAVPAAAAGRLVAEVTAPVRVASPAVTLGAGC